MTGDPAGAVGRPEPGPAHDPDLSGRRDRLRRRLGALDLSAAVVTSRPNVAYLSGFRGSYGTLVVTAGDAVLVTDGRYRERAGTEAPGTTVVAARDWIGAVLDRLAATGGGPVGFESSAVSYADGRSLLRRADEAGVRLRAMTDLVEPLRVVKDRAEIDRLAEACRITVAAFEELVGELGPGWTEREVAVALERELVDRGAEQPAFDTIVAGGPNGAVPHHAPTPRTLRTGELVTVDCGARVDGYHADMTRTVAIGHPPERLAEVHEVVRAAQAAGRRAAVAGAPCGAVDDAARDVITEAGHADGILHGVGHGVGLEIHEAPILSSADATLRAGTVITVEPGIYLPEVGGVRIEDTIVVTEAEPRVLTPTSRQLRIL